MEIIFWCYIDIVLIFSLTYTPSAPIDPLYPRYGPDLPQTQRPSWHQAPHLKLLLSSSIVFPMFGAIFQI